MQLVKFIFVARAAVECRKVSLPLIRMRATHGERKLSAGAFHPFCSRGRRGMCSQTRMMQRRCDTIHNRARVTPAGHPIKNVEINDDPRVRVLLASGVERFQRRVARSLDPDRLSKFRDLFKVNRRACRVRNWLKNHGIARGNERNKLPLNIRRLRMRTFNKNPTCIMVASNYQSCVS